MTPQTDAHSCWKACLPHLLVEYNLHRHWSDPIHLRSKCEPTATSPALITAVKQNTTTTTSGTQNQYDQVTTPNKQRHKETTSFFVSKLTTVLLGPGLLFVSYSSLNTYKTCSHYTRPIICILQFAKFIQNLFSLNRIYFYCIVL